VLSRIAEALFWIGRYTERAEATARILDVHVHRVLEDPWLDSSSACRSLLAVMGVPSARAGDVFAGPSGAPVEAVAAVAAGDRGRRGRTEPGEMDAARVTELLGYDPGNPSSIVGAISAARENARGARDVVSSEMWECLNATWNELGHHQELARKLGPHVFFRYIRERTAMFAGLVDATLARDDGWRFLVVGRSLERVDMTARLLGSSIGDDPLSQSWVSLLRSCGAHEAYVRTYRRVVDASRVAEFMLLDRLFPRSAYWALSTAEECLEALDGARGRTRSTVGDAGRRIVGRARNELEFRSVDELVEDMPDILASLQRTCSAASEAVTARYFAREAPPSWAIEVLAS
jgi:uncharacterized alpha-E superfamily protein